MYKIAFAATVLLLATVTGASAQTCADQNQACLARGHTPAECTKSTNSCLSTGRWIGPAGREFPISKKK
jgi:hypothetical protein